MGRAARYRLRPGGGDGQAGTGHRRRGRGHRRAGGAVRRPGAQRHRGRPEPGRAGSGAAASGRGGRAADRGAGGSGQSGQRGRPEGGGPRHLPQRAGIRRFAGRCDDRDRGRAPAVRHGERARGERGGRGPAPGPGRPVHRGPSAARDRRWHRDPAAFHPARADRAHRGRRAARRGGARAADLQRAGARRAARRGRGRSRRNRGLARARGGRRGRAATARHRRSAAPARPSLNALMDDTGCHILHVDMDAFYASVEIRDRPELAGRAVIVGGTSGRGVVLSASYQARAFGVRSAMPVGRAQRMCPHAVFVAPRHRRYAEVSKEVMAVFGTVTPEVEPLALDEAFLDVAGALRRLGPPAVIARHVRAQVAEQQGITCSVGVATTKFVAKIASARCKPDGLLVVSHAGTLDFLHALPVSALWGVGERTGAVLARLGLRTVADIAHTPLATLQHELGVAQGSHRAALAWGRDERQVTPHIREKSIGAEETFAADIDDPERIRRELLKLSGRTAHSLRAGGYAARTVSVKLRLASFKTMTRSRTLPYPTDVAREIYATACALYESAGLDHGARLRLVGVRVSGLVPAAGANAQLTFDDRPVGWREAEQAVDRIASRFGASAVRPAALVEDPDRPS